MKNSKSRSQVALAVGLKEQGSWMWFEGTGLYLFRGKMFYYPMMVNVMGKGQLWGCFWVETALHYLWFVHNAQ